MYTYNLLCPPPFENFEATACRSEMFYQNIILIHEAAFCSQLVSLIQPNFKYCVNKRKNNNKKLYLNFFEI